MDALFFAMKSFTLIFLSFVLFACSGEEQKAENTDTKKEQPQKADTAASEIVDAKTSRLTMEMRAMEQQMKWLRSQIDSNEQWNSDVFIDFHKIDTLQATEAGINQGERFRNFSAAFRGEYSKLIHEKQTREQFSLVVQECVNCHQVYCTGPIPRIKKLDR